MKCIINECKKILKICVLAQVLAVLVTASAIIPKSAAAEQTSEDLINVRMYVNDVPYPGRAVLYNDTTYVELGEFASEVHACETETDHATGTVRYKGDQIVIEAVNKAQYLVANDRYLWCKSGVFTDNGYAYVPLRAAAKSFGADVVWNAEEFAAYIYTGDAPILHGDSYYNDDEVYWLSRIIHAEAGIEPFHGQIAVGNVVLNRVRDASFPDTIYGVIFDRKYGVQFTPIANGTIYCAPDEDAVIAAKLCLEGYTLSEDILYFLNTSLATNFWVPQNRDYVMTISGHDFYS